MAVPAARLSTDHLSLPIDGMTCASCVARVERELERERAFGIARISRVQLFRDDEAKHPVAQKFQPLVGDNGIRT